MPGAGFASFGDWPSADESDGGVDGENLEDILENHDGRLWGEGVGGGGFRSTELLRLRPPDLGMGMGFVSEEPFVSAASTGP